MIAFEYMYSLTLSTSFILHVNGLIINIVSIIQIPEIYNIYNTTRTYMKVIAVTCEISPEESENLLKTIQSPQRCP